MGGGKSGKTDCLDCTPSAFFNDADLLKDGWMIRDKSKPKEESNQPFQMITLRSTAELFIK
jgi:hypothetical protein